jgi:hypothetical protein
MLSLAIDVSLVSLDDMVSGEGARGLLISIASVMSAAPIGG